MAKKEEDRIEKDWRLHHPIQATLRDWRKGISDGLDGMTNWMKDDPNWAYIKGFGDAAFGILGDATFGAVEFGVDLAQYTHEGLTFGYNSLMGKETPQWMKDDLEGGKNALGEALLNTLGTAYGLVTMIPEVNDLINALDDSTRDGSLMGSILHDARHAKDLKQQPIRDKIELAGQFSGYESGQAAGEIISEIVSFIGPAKLAKIAGKSKLISRLSQVPKIEKGLSYIKQARTMLSDNYLSTLARESYGATKDFFRSRLGNLWDDFSRKKFAFAELDNFRYGEDIGKHTARLYQSTSEGAEYQRLRRALYSEAAEHGDDVARGMKEAAEQAGKKARQEFSKEASEQLAKHSDDVAKVLEEPIVIDDLSPKDIPTVKSGYFEEFFNRLTPEQLEQIWDNKHLRRKIERQLRAPGGMHEWHLVSRAPQFKRWGINAEQIRDLRTAISDVKFVNPTGVHGGLGSTLAHNELLGIIDSSLDYETFVRRLNNWANYRLDGGIASLPEGLRFLGK